MKENDSGNITIHISSKLHLNLTFNLLQCGFREMFPDEPIGMEADNTFHLFYIYEGLGCLETGNIHVKMRASQGFFIFPDDRFECKNTGDTVLRMIWLSFTGYLVEHYLGRSNITRKKPIFDDPDQVVGSGFRNLYDASQTLPNRYCRMMSILYDIFSYLLDVNPTRIGENYNYNAEFFAVKAIDYIEHHYDRNISADQIAVILGISRKHLYSVFHDILQISPRQYLIYYRMEKACRRLRTTSEPIQEISAKVGYTSQFYFAREFKRLLGQTPSAYRKHPVHSEIFSYLSFIPTIKERLSKQQPEIPVAEQILSVYDAPQLLNASSERDCGNNQERW